jgi:DedD protein
VDIRVKERLTGAVILVALIVLVVPELLSGTARRAGQPATGVDELPLRSVTVELGDETRSSLAARMEGSELSAPSKSTLTPAPEESSAAQSGLARQLPQSVESAPTVSAAPVARPAPRPSPAQPLRSGLGWSVQVGSFEGRERADRLARRLRSAGFTAFISESVSHGRKWYRVRVGPERDRVAARAMVVRLHSAGHLGSIIPP